MKIGKPQGFAILTVGLIFLTGAILVFISVPNWGEWVHDYPSSIDASQLPAQAQPLAGGIKAVFGPLLEQVGGYVRAAGYFGGSMLSVISLAMMGAGLTVIKHSQPA